MASYRFFPITILLSTTLFSSKIPISNHADIKQGNKRNSSPTYAAGSLPIRTVAAPGPTIGPPTWGIGDGQAGVCIGHVCISVNLAAGGIFITF